MVQPNERVFYDNDSIFISQYRFVTPNGSVFPTRSIQRVWGTVDKKPRSCLFGGILAIVAFLLFVGGLGLALGPGVSPCYDFGCEVKWIVAGVLLILMSFVCVILALKRGRRRYWAHFMFAGGATLAHYGAINYGDAIGRQPDYSVWSYDEDWASELIQGANDAMIGAQL